MKNQNQQQVFRTQKYARIDGLVAGIGFSNILSDMGKIRSGLGPFHKQVDKGGEHLRDWWV
jgi:hypothetical protein